VAKFLMLTGMLLLLVSGGYLFYQHHYVPELPGCDALEVQQTLHEFFRAHVGRDDLNSATFDLFQQHHFNHKQQQRHCTVRVHLNSHSAPLDYTLTWQDRAQRRFQLRTAPAIMGRAHALFLLEPLPACDSVLVTQALQEIFIHADRRYPIQLTAFSQAHENGFDTEPEQRHCQALRHYSDNSSTLFHYRVHWSDKRCAHVYVSIINKNAAHHTPF
jgi:hypothetical protein